MSKQTEALKLAREALEYISSHYMSLPKIGCMALAAVEEALAEQPAYRAVKTFHEGKPVYVAEQPAQQQEPVAWMLEWTFNGEERGYRLYDDERHCIFDAESDGGVCLPLYTSPPQRKPLTDKMREMLEVQGQDGNWNYDPYMQGMYNGMEYMLAMVEDREPVFREAPDKWLGDKKRKPLTDEEIDKLPWGPHEGNPMTFAEGLRDFARAIEAAHGIKEKNDGHR